MADVAITNKKAGGPSDLDGVACTVTTGASADTYLIPNRNGRTLIFGRKPDVGAAVGTLAGPAVADWDNRTGPKALTFAASQTPFSVFGPYPAKGYNDASNNLSLTFDVDGVEFFTVEY